MATIRFPMVNHVPAAEQGDMRLFVMNGRPLRIGKKYAAFRRVRFRLGADDENLPEVCPHSETLPLSVQSRAQDWT